LAGRDYLFFAFGGVVSFTNPVRHICPQLSLEFLYILLGGNDYEEASQYILQRFVNLNLSDKKQIYAHFTCATDTSQIKFVMSAVSDIIIQSNLRDCGAT
jgi:hypothetical protein